MRSPLSRRSFLRAAAVVSIGATLTACGSTSQPTHAPDHVSSADGSTGVPVGWVTLAAEHLVHTEKLSPPAGSRLFAYTTIALHEAVAAAEPEAGSLTGGLTGTPAMPTIDPAQHLDADAAAAAAARGVLNGLLGPDASAETRSAIDALHTDQRDQRAAVGVTDDVLAASTAHGERVAAAILDWARNDGFTARSAPYELPAGDGVWELAPPATAPVEPHWGTLRTFALDTAQQERSVAPPAYSAEPESEFAAQARQVYDASEALTDEQRAAARFWAGAPAVRWMTVAADQVREHDLGLADATQALALTGVALADASIASWAGKYEYNVVRPVSYIQRHIDPAWTPLLPTPGHPEFPAGHSAGATAAATVLTALFGNVPVTARDATGTESDRTHESFVAAATETADSRLYAGVHYPMGLDAGTDQGRRIGQLVLDRLGQPGQ
ncbi:MAG TPA: vanadium-dependent haloperoxidase [Blastococcus sp.]